MGIGAQGGTIKVVIDVKGQGDGAAVVDKTAKALKSLWSDEEIAKNRSFNAGVAGIGKSLSEGLKPVTEMGGGLAAVRMGMMGIPGAILGMATGLAAFAVAVKDAFARDPVKEFHDEFSRTIKDLERDVDGIVKKLADTRGGTKGLSTSELSAPGDIKEQLHQADLLLANLQEREKAAAGVREQFESSASIEEKALGVGAMFAEMTTKGLGEERNAQDEIKKVQVERTRLSELLKTSELSIAGISAEQLTNRILQAEAARTLNERLDITVQKSWALLTPLKIAGAALGGFAGSAGGVVGAIGAGPGINDAVNRELLKTRGGGGGQKKGVSDKDLEKILSDWKDEDIAGVEHTIQVMRQKEDRVIEDKTSEQTADSQWQDLNKMWAQEDADARAQGIRDISSAIMEGIPALDQYAASLGKITDVWAEYAKTSQGMGAAVATTIGGLAKVGAQQIKDERARAGVLAAINFGLFLASEFVPGMQAQAGGYLAGSIALGVVAATGIGAGGGGRSSGGSAAATPRQSLIRESSGGQSGPIVLQITGGNWYGHSPQETAEALEPVFRRSRQNARAA